jgi:hypothetical protein
MVRRRRIDMGVQVELADDEALVFFELLSSGRLTSAADKAENHALEVVLAHLEKQLATPFASDYREQHAAAKASLIARYG